MLSKLAASLLLFSTAWAAPQQSGYKMLWADDFNGASGSSVDRTHWIYQTNIGNSNGEVQTYTTDIANGHLSGDGQAYIIPKKSGNSWTSARLETQQSWNCAANKALLFQAEVWVPDFTSKPAKFAGLWPAFWAKGTTSRQGVSWPKCGEWDIMEVANNHGNVNQGTLHFIDANGNYNPTFHGTTTYEGGKYHTWGFKVDRRGGNWKTDTLTWYLDGKQFYQVKGSDIGTLQQWKDLAWQPYFMILQVAVGGGFAGGNPTDSTVSGYDSSMRVKYTAVYEST